MEYVSERSTFLVIRLNASKLNIPMNQDNDVREPQVRLGVSMKWICYPTLKAVRSAGYDTPSPIQECAIPPILEGKDLLAWHRQELGRPQHFHLPFFPEWTNQSKVPRFSFLHQQENSPYRLRKPWKDLVKTYLSYAWSLCTVEPATVSKSRNLAWNPSCGRHPWPGYGSH